MAASTTDLLQILVKNDYAKSLIVFVFFLVIAYVILSLLKTLVGSMVHRDKSRLDEMLVRKLETPISLLIAGLGLKFAVLPLNLEESVGVVANHGINTLLIILVTHMLMVITHVAMNALTDKYRPTGVVHGRTIFPLLKSFISIFVIMLGFLFVMVEWDVQVGPFLASLGLLGLAVSLALKDSLANVFGGISLILDKNFNVGDHVKLDQGEIGQVIDIGIRSTRIKTFDNEEIIMPNNLLSNMKIVNLARPDPTIRIALAIGVDYGSDPHKVKRVLLQTLQNINGIMHDPKPRVNFNKMADYYLEFKVYFYVPSFSEKLDTEDTVTTAIWYALKKEKINIPFPTRTIFMEKAKGN
ncbi:mechanosensitive ion channel family protein [Candidatus Woesearchaeota archaeon]|nr:mechanosensitive ion channel family protein [Candidatus Woesearchaeota archaeon]